MKLGRRIDILLFLLLYKTFCSKGRILLPAETFGAWSGCHSLFRSNRVKTNRSGIINNTDANLRFANTGENTTKRAAL